MATPYISIDIKKIENNTRSIASLCLRNGIEITGVTKVTCGNPHIAAAMIRGGVTSIGESRLENIQRLRNSGILHPLLLLRIPPLSAVDEIVATVDISLNSDINVIKGLSSAAIHQGKVHQIIMMIDLGDLREGVWPEDLPLVLDECLKLKGIKIIGIGTNLTCYGSILPSTENMNKLLDYAKMTESILGYKLRYISGGNSSVLPLLLSNKLPKGINHLRIGEGIILGKDTIYRNQIPNTTQDAFTLCAEVIEIKQKPSVSHGETGHDVFGNTPSFMSRGGKKRAILSIGREDVNVEGLQPTLSQTYILGASSDHLIVDVSEHTGQLAVNDTISFQMNYAALLAAMTSSYVDKKLCNDTLNDVVIPNIHIVNENELPPIFQNETAMKNFETLGFNVRTTPLDQIFSHSEEYEKTMFEKIIHASSNKAIPLIIGSDRRTTATAVKGFSQAQNSFGLFWIDSKAALKPLEHQPTDEDTLTRIIDFLRGYNAKNSMCGCTNENIVIIGIKQAEAEEIKKIKELKLSVYTMEDIDSNGIQFVMRDGLRKAINGTRGLFVHFNISSCNFADTLDSGEGINMREIYYTMELIASTHQLRSLSINGLHKDFPEKNSHQLERIILSAFGKKILGKIK